MLTGVDQSWKALAAQLLVLLVYLATVDKGVDQFWFTLLVNSATVDTDVDQSCKIPLE